MKVRQWLPWLAVILIAVAVTTPLWGQPFPYGDDIRLHFYRIPLVTALWQDGALYARWLPYLNSGYGSPLFNFYPPFTAYGLNLSYWLVGQNGTSALILFTTMAFLCTAVGMFLLGRALYGTIGGLFVSVFYTWSPHLVYQLYARGSLSNVWAMALFPFAAWALVRLGQRPCRRYLALATGSIALLLLSHTAASLLFLATLLPFAATAVYQPQRSRPTYATSLRLIGLAFALGFGLSAFSWLPALGEIGQTRYALEASKVDYSQHFADAFRWPAQLVATAHNPGLPKSPGFAQLGLGLATAVLAVRFLRRSVVAWPTAVAAIIGLGALFCATPLSDPLWQLLPPLRSLQFPWRLLDIPTFYLSVAAGFLFAPWPTAKLNRANRLPIVIGFAAVVVAFANMLPSLYPPRIHTLPAQPTLADATAVQQQFGIHGLTAWGEYSNSAIQQWPNLPFANAESAPLSQKLLAPPADITAVASTPWMAEWQTSLAAPATVTLAQHAFPGWHATVDGQPWPLQTDEDGRLQLQLPAGSHQLRLAFGRTPIRWIADLLGLLTMGLFVGLMARWRPTPSPITAPASPSWPTLVPFIGMLGLLLLTKAVYIDQYTNPLVAHLADGRLPHTSQPSVRTFNDQLQLVGYQLGTTGELTLFWQALQPPTSRYTVELTLHNAHGVPLQSWHNDAPGYMATTHWRPGQLVRDVYTVPLEDWPAPAAYSLSLQLRDGATGQLAPLTDADGATAVALGWVTRPSPLRNSPVTQNALFGEAIRLRHAALPPQIAVGEPLTFTLVWESVTAVDPAYTLFVHLLDADGDWVDGYDAQPLAGQYPTNFWQPGELINDERSWLPDLPPGGYQLYVGWYRLETGERLPLAGGGDSLFIGQLTIRP